LPRVQQQGTGLFLCKRMVELLKGSLWLDSEYRSGLPDCPGTRFVIDLNATPPLQAAEETLATAREEESSTVSLMLTATDNAPHPCACGKLLPHLICSTENMSVESDDDEEEEDKEGNIEDITHVEEEEEKEEENRRYDLPDKLKILFVDDDRILRRLFARCVKKVAPQWEVREASSGEASLQLVEEEPFDLIFMDQNMCSSSCSSSAEAAALLGSEAVALMRRRGVDSRICGLSANDVEELFIEAGADCFVFKPFPCEREAMIRELKNILFARRYVNRRSTMELGLVCY